MPHKPRRSLVLSVALGLATLCASAAAQDVEFSQETVLRLKDADGGLRLDETTSVRVRFVSERAARDGTFPVIDPYYAPLTELEARWNGKKIDGDQIGTVTPQSGDVFLAPGAVRVIRAPSVPKPGDRLEYRARRSYRDPAYAPVLRVPNISRVARFEVTVEHPDDVAVTFEVVSPRGQGTQSVARPGAGRTVLVIENVDRADALPLFAPDAAAEVLVHATRDGVDLLSTTPAGFAAWYRGLSAHARPDTLSPTLAAVAATLARETPRETVAAVHDYVRSSVRYLADARDAGAIVPRAPDVVVAQGYGDCKDRAFLASALAGHLGIDVDVVLLATAPVADFDAAHVSLYDHAIAAWDGPDGQTVYFDPTHRHVPFGSLPEGDVSARALRVSAAGGRRVVVPAPEGGPLLDVAVRAALDRPAEGEAEVTVRGEAFAAVRQALDGGRAVDLENVMSALASASLVKIELSRFEVVEAGADSARLTARADLSEFVIASPTKRYLPQTPFRAVSPEAPGRAGDGLSVWTDGRPDVRLVLDLDPGTLAAAPDSVSMGDPAVAAFSAQLTPADGRVRVAYRFRQQARRFDGAARDAYLALATAYLDARREMFVFRPADAETP